MMDDPRLAPIRRYNNNVSAVWAWVAAASAAADRFYYRRQL